MKFIKQKRWFFFLLFAFIGSSIFFSCTKKFSKRPAIYNENHHTGEGTTGTGTGTSTGNGTGTDDNSGINQGLKPVSKSISEIRALYQGSDLALTKEKDGKIIIMSGIVISDPIKGNYPKDILIVQEESSGIDLQLVDGSTIRNYSKGDSVNVALGSGTLTKVNGNLTITGITASSDIAVVKRGIDVTPEVVTLKELHDNFDTYKSTLVHVENVNINPKPSEGDQYSGDMDLDDGTTTVGDVQLHVEANSVLANIEIPYSQTGTMNFDFTGIALYNTNNDNQLWPRNTDDIKAYRPVNTPIVITGFLPDPNGVDIPEPGHASWTWTHEPGGYEYMQFMALKDIDFSKHPYSVVVCKNRTVGADGWADGGLDTYKFNLTEGKADKGTFFYVGTGRTVIDGYDEPGESTNISGANWIRNIVVNVGNPDSKANSTQTGDGFGLETASVLQNRNGGGGSSDGLAVFDGTTVTGTSVPLDAVFYNPPINHAYEPPNGYLIPNNEFYSQIDPKTGDSQPLFGEGTNTFTCSKPADMQGKFVTMGGVYTDKGQLVPRDPKWKQLSPLDQKSKLSDIESGEGVTVYK